MSSLSSASSGWSSVAVGLSPWSVFIATASKVPGLGAAPGGFDGFAPWIHQVMVQC